MLSLHGLGLLYLLHVRGVHSIRKLYFSTTFRLSRAIRSFRTLHLHQLDLALVEALPDRQRTVFTAHTSMAHVSSDYIGRVRSGLSKVDTIISVANSTTKELELMGVDPEKIVTITNSIDGSDLVKMRIDRKRTEIVWVGRVEREDKNPYLFVDIAKHFQEKGIRADFGVYGRGSELAQLKRYCKDRGIANVAFHGFAADRREVYRRAKLLLLTSDREAFPLVVLEALAAGVPIVSTEVGDVSNILSNGGGLIADGSPDDFLKCYNQIIDSEYDAYCEQARSNYIRNHSYNDFLDKMRVIYYE